MGSRVQLLLVVLGLAGFLGACASVPPSPWTDAAGDVADAELAEVCAELWEFRMSTNPRQASWLGDERYLGDLEDLSDYARDRRVHELSVLKERLDALDPEALGVEDRLTHRLLSDLIQLGLWEETLEASPRYWLVDPLDGPQVSLLSVAYDQPTETERQREQLLERWEEMPGYLDQATENLRHGREQERVASRHAGETVLAQLGALLATPHHESPLVAAAAGDGTWEVTDEGVTYLPAPGDALEPEERTRFVEATLALVRDEIYPAFGRYRDIVAETLPRMRPDAEAGVMHVQDGPDLYLFEILRHTSLDLDPEEIHAFGLEEIERIRAEMAELGREVFGTDDVGEIQRRLRSDPELHFATAEEIVATAEASLARAQGAVDQAFGLVPEAACVVVEIPEHEAPDSTIAYYREPAPDGSRPGRYYVNTFAPTTRPRYDAEVLAFHEAVPGHHTQIAIAQELEGLPLVRRHEGSTAYVEGWALYTERLCDELGLYSSDLDRLGMLSFDAWRASRLVVDTGLHALGWSRRQAIDFMVENTLLAENNCENEVDRYIAWPGQALAYKLGQREILALREEARVVLGERFSLAEFHDRVLRNGAVTLAVLREEIEAWLGASRGPLAP